MRRAVTGLESPREDRTRDDGGGVCDELAAVHRRLRRLGARRGQPEQTRRDIEVASQPAQVANVIRVCFAAFDTGDLGLAETAGLPRLPLRLAPSETGKADD